MGEKMGEGRWRREGKGNKMLGCRPGGGFWREGMLTQRPS